MSIVHATVTSPQAPAACNHPIAAKHIAKQPHQRGVACLSTVATAHRLREVEPKNV